MVLRHYFSPLPLIHHDIATIIAVTIDVTDTSRLSPAFITRLMPLSCYSERERRSSKRLSGKM